MSQFWFLAIETCQAQGDHKLQITSVLRSVIQPQL